MGTGARIRKSGEHEKASSRLKSPALHQNQKSEVTELKDADSWAQHYCTGLPARFLLTASLCTQSHDSALPEPYRPSRRLTFAQMTNRKPCLGILQAIEEPRRKIVDLSGLPGSGFIRILVGTSYNRLCGCGYTSLNRSEFRTNAQTFGK